MFGKLAILSAALTAVFCIAGLAGKIYTLPLIFAASYLGFFLLWFLSLIIFSRFISMKKKYVKTGSLFRDYTYCIITSLIQLFRIKLHVSGSELLPDEKFLLAGNHRAAMDPLLTMSALKKYNLGFIAKKQIFRIPIVRRLMHRCFCLPLDRDNIRRQAKTVNRAAEIIMSREASIGVYPEGVRNRSDELLPFMNGAFRIAKKAKCPVVAAVINNTETIVKNAPFKKTDVRIDIAGVLDKEYVMRHSTKEIGDAVFDMINRKMHDAKIAGNNGKYGEA